MLALPGMNILWNLVAEKLPDLVAKRDFLGAESNVHAVTGVNGQDLQKDAVIGVQNKEQCKEFGQNVAMTADALGRPLHDLRISLLDRCNFRCPYCMPETEFHADYEFLKRSQKLTHAEILQVVRVATELGVSKIRLTGGEPLLDKKIVDLVAGIAAIAAVEDLAMTTNGMLLAPVAQRLRDAGMHRVTISLDSIDPKIFKTMSGGRGDLGQVLAGIAAAEQAGFSSIKINVVVQRGVNDHAVLDVLRHFRGSGHIVRLIEFMDVGNRNGWRMDQVVPSQELLTAIQAQWPVTPVGRNYPGEVARRYQYADGQGEIGFISSVTKPFCGSCSRARLSADGVLYTCLFATQGTDLRQPIRNGASDDDLRDILSRIWLQRADRYSELRRPEVAEAHAQSKVEMYRIGG